MIPFFAYDSGKLIFSAFLEEIEYVNNPSVSVPIKNSSFEIATIELIVVFSGMILFL